MIKRPKVILILTDEKGRARRESISRRGAKAPGRATTDEHRRVRDRPERHGKEAVSAGWQEPAL